ncbi:MAG: M24 family metallopeptidase, partial [bacterium]
GAMESVKPGATKSEVDKTISGILGEGLVKLGFIKDKKDHRMFTLHGYGHWIGLEVHDVGAYTKNGQPIKLKPGMVFTIEPGIYVRPDVFDKMKEREYTEDEIARIRPKVEKYMNIGVRIEDDVLVTQTGYKNLSAAVPREIDAVEKLMKQQGLGNLVHASN